MLHIGRMGRFYALVAVVSSLLVACGDNLIDDEGQGKPTDVNGGDLQPLGRTTAEVCGAMSWSTMTTANPSMDLALVNWPKQTTVLAVPTGGGAMTGFALNDRLVMTTDPAGTKINLNDSFSSVAVNLYHDRLVATAVASGATTVNLLDPYLETATQIAKLDGTVLPKPGFFETNHQHVVVVGGQDGVSVTQFDDAWSLIGTTLVGATKPVTTMAATQMGDAVIATWSTSAGECYVQQLATHPGTPAGVASACANGRIAANVADDSAKIIFEGNNGIRVMHVAHTQMGGDSVQLRPDAHSPRIVFDGARYWVSYLDLRGDIIVGFLDEHNQLVSTSVFGPKPHRDAYELAMVDGKPWVFSVDPLNGYVANALCAVTSY